MRRRNEEGRIKTKVRSLLLEAGFEVVLWWEQHGDYRIHKYYWDLACWGCHVIPIRDFPRATKGYKIDMVCWATMTECAKYGLTVEYMDRDGWEIIPKTEDIAYDNVLTALDATIQIE